MISSEIQSRYTSPIFDVAENSYYLPIFSLGKNHPSQSRKLLGKTNFAEEIRCRIRKLWGKKFTEKLNKTKRRSLTHLNLKKYTKIYMQRIQERFEPECKLTKLYVIVDRSGTRNFRGKRFLRFG